MRLLSRSFVFFGTLVLLFLFVTFVNAHDKISLQHIKPDTIIYIGVVDEYESQWPPYEYYQLDDKTKSKKRFGYSLEVLTEIFSRYEIKYDFQAYPWKRVLKYLEAGDKIQMILPTSANAQRREKYLISRCVYSVTPTYFYLKEKYPEGITIKYPEQLLQYQRICGQMGFNYLNFGIEHDKIEREAQNSEFLFKKLTYGRCNIALARYEVIAGHYLVNQNFLTDDIGYAAMPGVEKENFYYTITRNSPFSNELLEVINEGIDRLGSQGRLEEMLKSYIPVQE